MRAILSLSDAAHPYLGSQLTDPPAPHRINCQSIRLLSQPEFADHRLLQWAPARALLAQEASGRQPVSPAHN
ncbi:hypothetical protein GOBAR_AA14683 [Gossypium barbadense]|uniref:Uncharacterized protein n=1 Tax=Gossypium barbadense TaxID=3634 RepID=A0A2P5XRJ2_GOSBA|nr:hypothetical protein GOBAR_AA14683 [Gossypium barbadense]